MDLESDLFSQHVDGLLDIGKVHPLDSPDDRHHQTLVRERRRALAHKRKETQHGHSGHRHKGPLGTRRPYLRCGNGHADVHVVPVDDLFGCVIDN